MFWKTQTENEVAKYVNDSIRMLSIREVEFEISFLPKGKDYKMTSNGNWSTENRQSGKPTRLLRKLLVSKEFSELDFELFNNQLRAIVETGNEFSIVTGEDITEWYHEEKYEDLNGTLGNSCMRYSDAQDYFEVYEDFAKMLILTRHGKLAGRAILWEIEGKTYMDRVYTNKDHLVDMFIDYAVKHKFYYRETQSLLSTGDVQYWLSPEDNYSGTKQYELTIPINKRYSHWPYLDTFRYLYVDDSEIVKWISTVPDGSNASADDPEGWYDLSNQYTWTCGACGDDYFSDDEDEMPDGMHYSDYSGCYYCDNCCYWSETLSDYIPINCAKEVFVSESDTDWIPLSVLQGDRDYINIDGRWYSTDCEREEVINFFKETNEKTD